MLTTIRILHTFIWAVMVACILALPIAGLRRRYRCAWFLASAVLMECAVLLFNHGRCPLTTLAERYTPDRSDNFDICLPFWLARHNKEIFGLLFAAGIIVLVFSWVFERYRR